MLMRNFVRRFSSKDVSYNIRKATGNDRQEILSSLKKWFFPKVPTTTFFKLRKESGEIYEDYERFTMKPMDLNPSLNLVAVREGKIIGVLLSKEVSKSDYTAPHLPNVNDKNLETFTKFWMHVRRETNLFGQFPDLDKVLLLQAACVDEKLRSRRISKQLGQRSLDLARELGLKMVFAECVSVYAAENLREMGFRSIYALKYEDYKVDGKEVLERLPPHHSVEIFVQKVQE